MAIRSISSHLAARCAAALLALSIALPQLAEAAPDVAVAPQYDTTHVYVSDAAIDPFVKSFVGTFGGKASPRAVLTVHRRQAGRRRNMCRRRSACCPSPERLLLQPGGPDWL